MTIMDIWVGRASFLAQITIQYCLQFKGAEVQTVEK